MRIWQHVAPHRHLRPSCVCVPIAGATKKKDLMKANLMVVWENLPLYHFKPYGSVASASCSARNCLQKATSALSRSSNFCQSSSVGEGSWEMIGQIRILDNLRVGEERKRKVYIFLYIYINIGQYQYIYIYIVHSQEKRFLFPTLNVLGGRSTVVNRLWQLWISKILK